MQRIPHRRLIGVLGGMGPAATIDFTAKLVMLTPARTDQEHVPLLVHGVPQIPDRSAAIESGSDAPFLPMVAGIMRLERGGAEAAGRHLLDAGADRLLLACTELPLALADSPLLEHCVDPTVALARACIMASFGATPANALAGKA